MILLAVVLAIDLIALVGAVYAMVICRRCAVNAERRLRVLKNEPPPTSPTTAFAHAVRQISLNLGAVKWK